MAALKAKQLLGQFRKSDADDPDIFITAVTALLADFPPCVVEHVCSPVTGMAVRAPWVPSIFDLREAAIAHMNFLIASHEVAKIAPGRLARINGRVQEALPPPREDRLTSEQLKAKYGGKLLPDDFGNDGVRTSEPKANYNPPTIGEIVAHYTANKRLGIPLHRPMKEESYGQEGNEEGHDEGVMADAVAAGSSDREGKGTRDPEIEAVAADGSGPAPDRAREAADHEGPPPCEEGDPGFADPE